MGCCSSSSVRPVGQGRESSDVERSMLLDQLGISQAHNQLVDDIAGYENVTVSAVDDITVDSIFEHPLLRQLFMIFVSSRLAEENGRFLLDMRELNKNSIAMSEDHVRTAIDFIVDEYIRRSSPMCINLPDTIRRNVERKADDRDTTEGAEALQSLGTADSEIRRLVRSNFLSEFKRWLKGEGAVEGFQAAAPLRALDGRKRVVIIGGGFCGAFAARELDQHPGLHVTMVDTKSFMEYTPSVLKVFCRPDYHEKIIVPHGAVVKRGDVVVGAVRAIRDREIVVNQASIPFDFAVVATGTHYPSSIKSVAISSKFRGKQVAQQRKVMDQAKSICIVGGGFVGCELASEIKETMPDTEVSLVHSRARLMQRLVHSGAGDPHELAMARLRELGVRLFMEQRATSWDRRARQVITTGGARVDADHVFWCGGPEPMTKFMVPHLPQTLDSRGYIQVDAHQQVVGAPGVFAGGDCMVYRLGDNDREARQRLRTLGAVDAIQLHHDFVASLDKPGGEADGGGEQGGEDADDKKGDADDPASTPAAGAAVDIYEGKEPTSGGIGSTGGSSSEGTEDHSSAAVADSRGSRYQAGSNTKSVPSGTLSQQGAPEGPGDPSTAQGNGDASQAGSGGVGDTGAQTDKGGKKAASRRSQSQSSVALPSDTGCVHEEKMAKNAVEHGIIIAENIKRQLEGTSLRARKPEVGINLMIISMGLKKGIMVQNGVAQAGDFVAKKDWIEQTVIAELAEGKHILH